MTIRRRELLSLSVFALLPQVRAGAQAPPVDLVGDLVAANHILATEGIVDGYGHVSVRSPRDKARFLLSRSIAPESVTAADILEYGLDGEAFDPKGRTSYKERYIHSEIYRARPDVNAVMHTHPQWSTFLTMTGVKYQPVYAQGVLLGDIPLMDSPLSINTKPMGEKMAQLLGRGPAVLLKAHGVVVVGADIVECFALAAYVEENAYRQYMAMQIGEPYVFSEAEQQASREKLWTPSLFKKTWDHYRSKLSE